MCHRVKGGEKKKKGTMKDRKFSRLPRNADSVTAQNKVTEKLSSPMVLSSMEKESKKGKKKNKKNHQPKNFLNGYFHMT